MLGDLDTDKDVGASGSPSEGAVGAARVRRLAQCPAQLGAPGAPGREGAKGWVQTLDCDSQAVAVELGGGRPCCGVQLPNRSLKHSSCSEA